MFEINPTDMRECALGVLRKRFLRKGTDRPLGGVCLECGGGQCGCSSGCGAEGRN